MSVTGYIYSALMKHWSYDPGLLIQGPPEKTVKRAVSSDKSVEGEQFEGGEGRPRSTIHITDCLRRMQAGAWGLLSLESPLERKRKVPKANLSRDFKKR